MNSDMSDIASALTQSLSRTGEGGMTDVLLLDDDGLAYTADTNTGIYRSAADTQIITSGGVDILEIGPAGVNVLTGTLDVGGTPVEFLAWSTGDVKLTLKTVADSGWVMCDDGTIGSASSGATTRANADTADLFALLWDNVSDTYAPVSGGRGANAAADFAANKTIGLTKMLGRVLGIAGAGSGLTSRAMGQTLGEETHLLDTTEIPSHTHTFVGDAMAPHSHTIDLGSVDAANGLARGGVTLSGADDTSAVSAGTPTGTNSNTGGGGAHNNMQPTSFLKAMIKL